MKKYLIEYPNLLKEWDYEKNEELNILPEFLTDGSHYNVWWKCEKGHSWQTIVSNRTRQNRGCPYCSHQLPIIGETDLASRFPDLCKQWHPTKNKLKPSEVMPGTHKKVWWICDLGHEWEAEIKSRTTGVGCPYCAGKKVLKGFNDLATLRPEIAEQWHPSKNGDLTPEDVTVASGKKVWWIQKNGYEWEAAVYNRTGIKAGTKGFTFRHTSFPEQAVYYYIKQVFPDAINSYRDIFDNGMELDIYIPSIKIGIEYDGRRYHSNIDKQLSDQRKYNICKEKGIKLIRIKEIPNTSLLIMEDHKIEIPEASELFLNWAIGYLCDKLEKNVVPDIKRDRKKILEYLSSRQKSLIDEYPDIADEWNYDKNGTLLPEYFAPHSNEKVWWKCSKCGHEWEAAIGDRTRPDSTGCPDCSYYIAAEKRIKNRIAKIGSFADNYPDLLSEWDWNNKIDPYEITPSSSQKVMWICKKCGSSWEADITHRKAGRGCPYCAGRKIKKGLNDLASLYPELMKEWDYEKNTDVDPSNLACKSSKNVWWKCSKCGHEWQARIYTRTSGRGCPNWRKHI